MADELEPTAGVSPAKIPVAVDWVTIPFRKSISMVPVPEVINGLFITSVNLPLEPDIVRSPVVSGSAAVSHAQFKIEQA